MLLTFAVFELLDFVFLLMTVLIPDLEDGLEWIRDYPHFDRIKRKRAQKKTQKKYENMDPYDVQQILN